MAPSDTAAVVGGNVESSQVITGVVLKAFKAAAASQSSCNNLTFGSGGKNEQGEHVEGWGYVRPGEAVPKKQAPADGLLVSTSTRRSAEAVAPDRVGTGREACTPT